MGRKLLNFSPVLSLWPSYHDYFSSTMTSQDNKHTSLSGSSPFPQNPLHFERSLFEHGGQVEEIMRYFSGAPRPFIDLSTGINPFSYPFKWPDKSSLKQLPQKQDEEQLCALIARLWDVPSRDQIVLAPGSQLLISLLPLILAPKNVYILSPTYSGHRNAWNAHHTHVHHIKCFSDLLESACNPQSLCILCNPNNPDGTIYTRKEIEDLISIAQKNHSHLIIDEAYRDFCIAPVPCFAPGKNLIILRSFGKTFGLGGLRVGFLLASESIASKMRQLTCPWSVSTLGLAIARQALSDQKWFDNTRHKVTKTSNELCSMLQNFGLSPQGQAQLFTLIHTEDAFALWKHLCAGGILTRYFPGDHNHLRIGLPATQAEMKRLKDALESYVAS